MTDSRTRVFVTGMGAMTPLGTGVEDFWSALVAGQSGIGPITLFDASEFPCRIGGEVDDFEPTDHMDRKAARRMARFSQLAVAATREAVENSGLDLEAEDRSRIGIILGNGNGGFPNLQEMVGVLNEKGGMRIEPFFIPRILPNMAAANVAMQFGLVGFNNTVVTACAAGTQAIGDASEVIRRGAADVMICGGTEAGFCALGMAGFAVMRALSTSRNDDPQAASRPFDAGRDGFVAAEGAAIVVLESEAHARARGADLRAEVGGFGCSGDAYHLVAPDQTGAGPVRAMEWALQEAGVAPEELDYINAHGTSTPINDGAETRAIKMALGDAATRVAISSTKSMTGHSFGAAGAMEAIATVRTLETGTIHPTINQETADPDCDLDYVPNVARESTVRVALSNSFGFGGQNACLVFRAAE
ncbi:MAG: 3-oxoacyl-[acyl-carrier-protein] synthase II [Chloroflexi bacterium]|nr:MAG: 3-oxoacyl-[acyl-carrier-protein] synthase II [Chloroflexota bacterium]